MGPWYSGDGIGEKYLEPEYKDPDGQLVISVEDYFTSLNRNDPGPYVFDPTTVLWFT